MIMKKHIQLTHSNLIQQGIAFAGGNDRCCLVFTNHLPVDSSPEPATT